MRSGDPDLCIGVTLTVSKNLGLHKTVKNG